MVPVNGTLKEHFSPGKKIENSPIHTRNIECEEAATVIKRAREIVRVRRQRWTYLPNVCQKCANRIGGTARAQILIERGLGRGTVTMKQGCKRQPCSQCTRVTLLWGSCRAENN